MATPFYDNIFVESAKLIDAKWGPFASTGDAYLAVPKPARQIGMFAIIAPPGGTASLYWYKDNTTTLVPFAGNSSVEVYATFSAFPATGSANVIYIDKSESQSYYWNNALIPPAYVLTSSNVEVYNNSILFPQPGVENVIYIADDTNTSYVWNSALLNGNGDYEVISGSVKQVELQANATHIQWRYVGDSNWIDLVALEDLKGDKGDKGDQGDPGLVYLGNYVLGNGYIANIAVVKGSDNNLYIAKASGGLADPVGNTAEWDIFLPKGVDGDNGDNALWNFTEAYSGGATYAVGDIATFDGETWYRINSNGGNVGDTPAEGTFWTKIAAKGADGENGLPPEWQFQGPWQGFPTIYEIGDIVTYQGETWYNDGSATDTPSTANGWELLAAKGADGSGGILYIECNSIDTNAYTITTGNNITANTVGDTYLIKFNFTNTTTPTLQIDNAAVADLYNSKTGLVLVSGDIQNGVTHLVVCTSIDTTDIFEVTTIGGGGTIGFEQNFLLMGA